MDHRAIYNSVNLIAPLLDLSEHTQSLSTHPPPEEPVYDTLVNHLVRGAPGGNHEVQRVGDLAKVAVGREGADEVSSGVGRQRGPTARGVAEEAEAVEGAALGGVGPGEAADGPGIAGEVWRGGECGEEAEDEVRAGGAECEEGRDIEDAEGKVDAEVGGEELGNVCGEVRWEAEEELVDPGQRRGDVRLGGVRAGGGGGEVWGQRA